MRKKTKGFKRLLLAAAVSVSAVTTAGLIILPVAGITATEVQAEPVQYTLDATICEGLPGVYKTKARVGDSKETATIGIPSVAKQTLNGGPTTESPAIIMGAAVNYEKRTGATEFTPIPGAELVAPYSYFRWGVMDEQMQDEAGNVTTHRKLSGFDGTYYIIRVDVSDIIKDVENPENKYLHVKQNSNSALMVACGIENLTFSDALGNKTGSYSLANAAAALKDTTGADQDTPYFDVIVMSSGKLVAGADTGKQDAPSADISLSFYVDDVADYNPELKYDPASTDPNHAANVLKKFFNDEKATAANNASSYTVKGSDLEIDSMVEETVNNDGIPEFSSLTDAMYYQPYNAHTIKLICEAPVLQGLTVSGTADNRRSVILDVNSFDIQIANNTQTSEAGLSVVGNAELTIKDGSHTAGAELAVGNNAMMDISDGGTLIIDETCTVDVEYDAATTPADGSSTQPAGNLLEGVFLVGTGGRVINHGVFNIEGTEGKPLDPVTPTVTDMKSAAVVVGYDGTFDNYGALSVKGGLTVLGTLNNYGKYDELINATDPDKGTVTYHKGIQVTWKDDVRREGVKAGYFEIGIYEGDTDFIAENAVVNNMGDIVLAPGTMNVYATVNNADGNIYINDATEAMVPIQPTQEAPLVHEIRVKIDPPKKSEINVNAYSNIISAESNIQAADVEVVSNGHLGKLTPTGEAIKDAVDIKATDWVIGAHDGYSDLIRDRHYVLKDGGVEFLPEYLSSFSGKRTVRINIGYRYLYIDVTGTGEEPTDLTTDSTDPSESDDTSGSEAESADKSEDAASVKAKKSPVTGDTATSALLSVAAATAAGITITAVAGRRKRNR